MWQYQGFATKEEAKKTGRRVLSADSKAKYDRVDYQFLVECQGLDPVKYPYAVQWRI